MPSHERAGGGTLRLAEPAAPLNAFYVHRFCERTRPTRACSPAPRSKTICTSWRLNFLLPDVFSNSSDFDDWFDLKDKKVEQEVVSQLHRVLKLLLP